LSSLLLLTPRCSFFFNFLIFEKHTPSPSRNEKSFTFCPLFVLSLFSRDPPKSGSPNFF
jgi:hypothetical protein